MVNGYTYILIVHFCTYSVQCISITLTINACPHCPVSQRSYTDTSYFTKSMYVCDVVTRHGVEYFFQSICI